MTDNSKALIWLDSFDFISYKKKEILLEKISPISKVINYDTFKNQLKVLNDIFSEEEISILKSQCLAKTYDNLIKNLDTLKIKAITYLDEDYPIFLKNIDTPPFVLYCLGNTSLLKQEGFAVVGSRHITSYGKQVTEKFTTDLIKVGFTIISGLASGVDTVAHLTALNNHGKTIAVLAGGLDEIYPKTNTNLAKNIMNNNGLLISEVRPYKKAEAYMFPIRNRIIAALSKGVLITEAQEKSGALHTKNYALDYGKDVFSVPGSIYSISSVGTNRIIVSGHAKAVVCSQDILDEYNLSLNNDRKINFNVSIEESIILEALKEKEMTFQELKDLTNFETKVLNSLLTTLLIRGLIKKLAGNIYYLVN